MKHIGKAPDIKEKKWRYIYRFFEILPGLAAWGTLTALVVLSRFRPVWVAIFIITFDLYWLFKIIYLAIHLISGYRRLKKTIKINWSKKCPRDYYHLIILPTYKESRQVLETTFKAILKSKYPKDKMIVVLAMEKRAGPERLKKAAFVRQKFASRFGHFLVTHHPGDIEGEIAGKGSNETWAGKKANKFIKKLDLPEEKIICSVFDIDTCVHPQYFARLSYCFDKEEKPHRASYQPIPMYHNNIWDSPALMRVIASSNTFWQMMQQERPEKLNTFSSHSMSFKTAREIGWWQNNIVSEDSRIFFQCLFHFGGDYKVVPLFIPVYMDTVLGDSWWASIKNQYKQQRRWAWGVENVPWIFLKSLRNHRVSLWTRLRHCWDQFEGFYSWSIVSLLVFMLGWLPVLIGGASFQRTVLAFNLPQFTSKIMTVAMLGMLVSAIVSLLLFPSRPKGYKRRRWLWVLLQWVLLPVTSIVFGSVAALDAQTRLMLGKYMGFFVTPKERK